MDVEQAKDGIARQVRVTRPQIVAARSYLLSLGTGRIEIKPQSIEWAGQVAPGAPGKLTLPSEDAPTQIAKIAQHISARLALGAAAWDVVRSGLMFQIGQAQFEEFGWDFTDGGYSGGINWEQRFVMMYPESVWRPPWLEVPSDLLDADLYIQRLVPLVLHSNVERALRLSLNCFQQELFIPCVAMLGAASEGAWIELGESLTKRFPAEPTAGRLSSVLADQQKSTKGKIAAICDFYDRPVCTSLHKAAGIDNKRLRTIQQWSDQIRESRNVLHWGATPSVPNTYEKVAVLLMDAVSELTALYRVKDASRPSHA